MVTYEGHKRVDADWSGRKAGSDPAFRFDSERHYPAGTSCQYRRNNMRQKLFQRVAALMLALIMLLCGGILSTSAEEAGTGSTATDSASISS